MGIRMRAKIAIAFLSISLIASFGLASNQAFAGVVDPCEDCETQFDICLAGTGGDPILDSECVLIYKSCLEADECPIDACIQCDFDVANCILTSDQSQSAIDACFVIFDSCLATNQCLGPIVGGEFIGIDSTALLLVGVQNTSAWLIPIMVSGIGIGTLLLSQKSKLKNNSCPSCKFKTNDTFLLGGKFMGSCHNSKCRVSLFLVK